MTFKETETVELKIIVTPEIKKEIIAFANTEGGTIYVGVDNEGNAVGLANTDEASLQVSNMVRDSISPDLSSFIHYEVLMVDDKDILAITVLKGSDKPYHLVSSGYSPKGVFVRQGFSASPASEKTIRKMIREADKYSFETYLSANQELTFESLSEEFRIRNKAFDKSSLTNLKASTPEGYTNLGLLLADQCPFTMKIALFQDEEAETFIDRQIFEGSILRQLNEVYGYIDKINKLKSTFKALVRIDQREYHETALREGLVNTIIHRDYSNPASTLIKIYPAKIEILSVGGLPTGISLEDLNLGLSVCRNPNLANVFYRLELVEAFGTGIKKIMNSYKNCFSKPVITTSKNAFLLTLPNQNHTSNEIKEVKYSLIDDEEDITLSFVREKGSISRKEADQLLGTPQATTGRFLRRLSEEGKLKTV